MDKIITNDDLKKLGLEIWQINEIETWIGYSWQDIRETALRQTGVSRDELFDDPRMIPFEAWSKIFITDQDAPFSPMYTYLNFVKKMLNEGPIETHCFSSTEF